MLRRLETQWAGEHEPDDQLVRTKSPSVNCARQLVRRTNSPGCVNLIPQWRRSVDQYPSRTMRLLPGSVTRHPVFNDEPEALGCAAGHSYRA